MVLAEGAAAAGQGVGVQVVRALMLTQVAQVEAEAVCGGEGVGVVLAEGAAAAGQGVGVQVVRLLILTQLAQVEGEVFCRAQSLRVIRAQLIGPWSSRKKVGVQITSSPAVRARWLATASPILTDTI